MIENLLKGTRGEAWDKNSPFFMLLRYALGISEELPDSITVEEWKELYEVARKHAIVGILSAGIRRMPQHRRPPIEMFLVWYAEAERVAQANELANSEAQRWTRFFADMGRRSCILKGQGNALMYPDPLARTPGDIDIYVEGGREQVMALLEQRGIHGEVFYHHVEFVSDKGVMIEVHFLPSQGSMNQKYNERIQAWSEQEIRTTREVNGFHVPTPRFNRVMQLGHMQHHFVQDGSSMRQLIDYYFVLKQEECPDMTKELKHLGLWHYAQAVMYVMQTVFHLDEKHMPVRPDKWRGEVLLTTAMEGGNFGQYTPHLSDDVNFVTRNIYHSLHNVYDMFLFPEEYVTVGKRYWENFFRTRILHLPKVEDSDREG